MCIKASNVTVELTNDEIEIIKESLLSMIDYLNCLIKIPSTGVRDLDFILNNNREVSKKKIDEMKYILSNKLA